MADNYLENHYEEYERRKAEWLRRKRHLPKVRKVPHSTTRTLERPEDEAL